MPLTVNIEANVIRDVSADIKANLDPLQANIDAVVQSGDDKYVPFRLAAKTLAITDEQTSTKSFREAANLYVDANNTNFRVSVQQIKELNTKIETVAKGNAQAKAQSMDVGDYIYEEI